MIVVGLPYSLTSLFAHLPPGGAELYDLCLTRQDSVTSAWPGRTVWPLFDPAGLYDLCLTRQDDMTSVWRGRTAWPLFDPAGQYDLYLTRQDKADDRGKVQTSSVTVFVNVLDVGDTAPRWLRPPMASSLDENTPQVSDWVYVLRVRVVCRWEHATGEWPVFTAGAGGL